MLSNQVITHNTHSYTYPAFQGVRAVLAESFERIHRSNLVGMGIVPLQFLPGENAATYNLNGKEKYSVQLPDKLTPGMEVIVMVSYQLLLLLTITRPYSIGVFNSATAKTALFIPNTAVFIPFLIPNSTVYSKLRYFISNTAFFLSQTGHVSLKYQMTKNLNIKC